MSAMTLKTNTRRHLRSSAFHALSVTAAASLLFTIGLPLAPAAEASVLPVTDSTPGAVAEDAEESDGAAGEEEEPAAESAGTGENAEAADSGNAEVPDKGDYTCLAPGKHELNVEMGIAFPKAFLLDHSVNPAAKRIDYEAVVPVPQYSSRAVTAEDIAAGFGAVAPQDSTVWILPQNQNPKLSWTVLNTNGWDYTRSTDEGMRTVLGDFTGPGKMKLWTYDQTNGLKVLVDSARMNETGIITNEKLEQPLSVSFDRPGFYEVEYLLSGFVNTENGGTRRHSARYTIYYAVGDEMVRQVCGEEHIPANDPVEHPGSSEGSPSNNTETTPVKPTEENPVTPPANNDSTPDSNTPGETAGENVVGAVGGAVAGSTDENGAADGNASSSSPPSANHGGGNTEDTSDEEDEDGFKLVTSPKADKEYNELPDFWKDFLGGLDVGKKKKEGENGATTAPEGEGDGEDADTTSGTTNGESPTTTNSGDSTANNTDSTSETAGSNSEGTGDGKKKDILDDPKYKDALWKALFGNKDKDKKTGAGDAPQSAPTANAPQSVPSAHTPQSGDKKTDEAQSGVKQADQSQSGVKQPDNSKTLGAKQNTAPQTGKNDKAGVGGSNNAGAQNTPVEPCVATTITRESEPGEADKIRHATAEQGTARTKLTFSVGDNARGNANDGHFDLGPIIEKGTLFARVKDDRNQPAQWLDPEQLVFGVGPAAALSAPKSLDFITTPGQKVWMIQQTQQPNVPWLGMNSQHESLQGATTGEVTFTLEAINGPGKVAVFESGSFGGGVGKTLFNGAGSSYTLNANTHAHQNWVFTAAGTYELTIAMKVESTGAPLKGSASSGGLVVTGETGPNGRPMVEVVVGRTPSGKECDLAAEGSGGAGGAGGGKLASTGAIDVLPLAFVTLLLGGGAVVARKRRS